MKKSWPSTPELFSWYIYSKIESGELLNKTPEEIRVILASLENSRSLHDLHEYFYENYKEFRDKYENPAH